MNTSMIVLVAVTALALRNPSNRLKSTVKVQFSISIFRQLVCYIHYMPSPYGQDNNIIDTLKQDNITNIDYQHPHNSQLKLEHIKRKRLIRFAWDFYLGIF